MTIPGQPGKQNHFPWLFRAAGTLSITQEDRSPLKCWWHFWVLQTICFRIPTFFKKKKKKYWQYLDITKICSILVWGAGSSFLIWQQNKISHKTFSCLCMMNLIWKISTLCFIPVCWHIYIICYPFIIILFKISLKIQLPYEDLIVSGSLLAPHNNASCQKLASSCFRFIHTLLLTTTGLQNFHHHIFTNILVTTKEFKRRNQFSFWPCVNTTGWLPFWRPRMEVSYCTSGFGAIIWHSLRTSLPNGLLRYNLNAYVI